MCSIPLLKARGQCTVFSSVAAQSSLRSSGPCWVSGRCDGAMQTSVEPSPCRSVSPCSAELPVPCCAPRTFLWAALAHSDPFRSDFSLKAGMLSGKKGGAPTCQNGIAACVLLQSLGSLYSSWSLDFLFFFLNSWESIQLWNFPCIWRCTSPRSYFQHLTSTKISEVF